MAVNFKELGIKPITQGFVGDKIKIKKILNTEVTVHAYKLQKSNFEGKGMRLDLQISLQGTQHVVFTGSGVLIDMIERVPKDKFPFITRIIEDNDRFLFT